MKLNNHCGFTDDEAEILVGRVLMYRNVSHRRDVVMRSGPKIKKKIRSIPAEHEIKTLYILFKL